MYVGHQASGLLVRAGRNAIPTTSKTESTWEVDRDKDSQIRVQISDAPLLVFL